MHVPSKFVDPAHSPALAAFLDHVDVAIAIHGYGRDDRRYDVLLGGPQPRRSPRTSAPTSRPRCPTTATSTTSTAIPLELRGLHPDNPVNRPRAAGVQLELPPLLRWHREHWGWSDTPPTGRAPQVEFSSTRCARSRHSVHSEGRSGPTGDSFAAWICASSSSPSKAPATSGC